MEYFDRLYGHKSGTKAALTFTSGEHDGKKLPKGKETTEATEDVVVCSGLTSISTIFQTYHDGVGLRQGAQCSPL